MTELILPYIDEMHGDPLSITLLMYGALNEIVRGPVPADPHAVGNPLPDLRLPQETLSESAVGTDANLRLASDAGPVQKDGDVACSLFPRIALRSVGKR
jgi:hypothetical protein